MEKQYPLISVITVSYNAVSTIEDTIRSVINQTYPNIEYIIIDGGSTDGTVDIIEKYADRISYWVSEPDKGIYSAMNKGIKIASGEWINFMNSGDSFFDSLVLAKVFSYPLDVDIIAGKANIGLGKSWKIISPISPDKLSLFYFYTGGLCHQATFIRKSLLLENPYDETLKIVSDSKFFIQSLILNNCSYALTPVIICNYVTNGISSDKIKNKMEHLVVINQLFPHRILLDYENMINYYNPFFRLLLPIVRSRICQRVIFPLLTNAKQCLGQWL